MKRHILVIDDEAEIRELLGQFLNASGFLVTGASCRSEALTAVQQGRPDLIISDLQLEDADGLELITALKASCPDSPVILLTGVLFEPGVVQSVLGAQGVQYIPKTSPLTRILEVVRTLLSGDKRAL